MARIRTIKPEFFTHEGLAELSPLQRLFFIGLWTQADREGRLEDRPKRLKAVILPYDDCDVVSILDDLTNAGFLVRYEADGKPFLQIPAFGKHQRPHPKEPMSDIPAQPSREKKRQVVKKNGETMPSPSLREGVSLREGKESPLSPPGDLLVPPQWLSSKLWEDFKDHRKALKAKMTLNAEKLALSKLENFLAAGEDPQAIVKQSIEMGWKGLFALNNGSKPKTGADVTRERTKEALKRGL